MADTNYPPKVVEAFVAIDTKIKDLYAKRERMIAQAIEKYGTTEGVIEVKGQPKPFARLKITDQIDSIQTGQTVYTTASFNRYRVEITRLLKPPKPPKNA